MRLSSKDGVYKSTTFKTFKTGCAGLFVMAGDRAIRVTHVSVNKSIKGTSKVIFDSVTDTETNEVFIYIKEIIQ